MPDIEPVTIWTVGHSNHAIDGFLDLLSSPAIALLAYGRRFPGSKRHPQFGQENLNVSLEKAGVGYRHFPGLGGRRNKRLPDSPNTAWRVESFNAYADYMQTPEFQTALAELIAMAQNQNTVIMCAEAFLGVEYEPFVVHDPSRLPDGVTATVSVSRYERRLGLLDRLEDGFAAQGGAAPVADHRGIYGKASRMVVSPKTNSFDINSEPESLRERYGTTNFGRGCLLARRLVEAGVTCVEVRSNGWDMHQDNFTTWGGELCGGLTKPCRHFWIAWTGRGYSYLRPFW